jgi:hypothetical protein
MATLYWYGGSGTWSDGTTHWSTNSGNIPSAPHATPTISDDVITDTLSNATAYTITINNTGASCKSFNFGAPLTGNLTITTNSTFAFLSVAGNSTITGTPIIQGSNAGQRLLIQSSTLGTPRVVTVTGATIAGGNFDLQDIQFNNGGADLHLESLTNPVGDCGGNGMSGGGTLYLTASSEQHWVTATDGNWSGNNWSHTTGGSTTTGRVPLPQDNVFMDCNFGTSHTVTIDVSRIGAAIDWSSATWTTALTWTNTATFYLFGSLILVDNLTIGGNNIIRFAGRGSYTLNSHSITLQNSVVINIPTGTVQLAADLTLGVTRTLFVTLGTLTCVNGGNNYVISAGLVSMTSPTSATLTLGSATHLLTGTGSVWSCGTSGVISANTSTLKITDTSNTAITFAGGGKTTYNNLWFARGASTATNTISGSNTFVDFKDDGSAAHQITFTTGTTQTVTTFTAVSASSGNLLKLRSSTTTNAILTKSGGGTIQCYWMDVDYITGNPDNTWYMGSVASGSVDGGHNTRIYFTGDNPAPTNTVKKLAALGVG